MATFSSLNYCTIYESIGTVNHPMNKDCCFHTVICDSVKEFMDNNYKIVICIGTKYVERTANNNACLLSKGEIERYLRIIKSYFPFEFSISKYTFNDDDVKEFNFDDIIGCDYYELNVHISDNMMIHKFILKMIRALYEFPFNMALMDVLKLRFVPRFKRFNTANLYLMTGYLLMQIFSSNDDQFICSSYHGYPNFKSVKEWKDALIKVGTNQYKVVNYRYINDIHDYYNPFDNSSKLENEIKNYCSNNDIIGVNKYDISYWNNNDNFDKRIKLYNHYLKEFIR